MNDIKPIETRYAGHRFRSRLEARWAVFFDHLGIRWEYEPQGYVIDKTPYLPDFWLPQFGTWVEVKGAEEDLDQDLMIAASDLLPNRQVCGPRLLILGPMPEPPAGFDWAWIGITKGYVPEIDDTVVIDDWWGFGQYPRTRELVRLGGTSSATPVCAGGDWLTPAQDPYAHGFVPAAYKAARAARFEHGERG